MENVKLTDKEARILAKLTADKLSQPTPEEQVRQEIMEISKYTKAYAANFYGKGGPRTRVQLAALQVVWRVLDGLQNPPLVES